MAPPPIPGSAKYRGGPKNKPPTGRTQKLTKFKKGKNEKGSNDKPKRPGFLASWLTIAGSVLGLLGFAYHQNRQHTIQVEARDTEVRHRLASKPLKYSDHGTCRMVCRHINRNDVRETMEKGKVSERHSKFNSSPCPRYALDHGRVRAVFGDCADHTAVITVIDTVTDHPCPVC